MVATAASESRTKEGHATTILKINTNINIPFLESRLTLG